MPKSENFPKSKRTFLNAAGRGGTPSARSPMFDAATLERYNSGAYQMSKKPRPDVKTASVKMGKPRQAKKGMVGIASFKMSKKPTMPARGRKDAKSSSFFMSKKPAGKSATRSPQSTPMSYRPRG